MVHPEVVLEGDGGEGLRRGLDLHVFLCLDSLVETVAPAASLHDTACLLINDLDLVVDDDIVNILLEHGVSLQELDHGMDPLTLEGIFLHQFVLGLLLLLRSQALILLDVGDLTAHVGKDEEIRIRDRIRQGVVTLIGHIYRVLLLADNEIKLVGHDVHLALIVLEVEVLRFLHEGLHTLLTKELNEWLILRQTLVSPEQEHSSLVHLAGGDSLLGVVEDLIDKDALLLVQALDIRPVLDVLLVILGLGDRSGYDQRGTGIVDQHGVNLIDDGVMVLPLHKVVHIDGHIVPKVIETELVVGTEGDVAVVCSLTGVTVGLVLVDAVHGEAMEHVQGTHPLGVSLGEVVVDSHDVDSLACQGVQEHRESRHEGLSLTGGHLGDAAHLILVGLNPSVQDDTSDQLDVVMDHVPGDLVSSCHPVVLINRLVALDRDEVVVDTEILVELGSLNHYGLVLLEPAGGGLHDSEGLRENLL